MSASFLLLVNVGIFHPGGRGLVTCVCKQVMGLLQQHDASQRLLIKIFLSHGFLFI